MLPKPKKNLGQNFLSDPRVRDRIIKACALKATETVVEIGPGRGVLTAALAREAGGLYAIEFDRQLCARLRQELAGFSGIQVIEGDFLTFDLARLAAKKKCRLKVIGNIPYNISTPIVERLIECKQHILSAYLMVQREFGQRIAAREGSKIYGALSCFVQYHFKPEIIFGVSKNSFYPAPKVDSLFIKLEAREKPAVEARDPAWLFKLIRTSFQHRRKTLKNCLCGLVEKRVLDLFFSRYRIRPDARPEMLSLQDFANLANLKNN